MKKLKPSDFPALRRVFSGYLHEDFLEEYGTPIAASRAFLADADNSERQRFSAETRRFLERTARLKFNEARALLARLGCRWTPPSRKAMIALLAEGTDGERGGGGGQMRAGGADLIYQQPVNQNMCEHDRSGRGASEVPYARHFQQLKMYKGTDEQIRARSACA